MANEVARIDYVAADYEQLRQQLVARIPLITNSWTDYNESDMGMTLLELMTGIADVIMFYIDNTANESFIRTARQRKNVMALLKLVGYEMHGRISAVTDVTITLLNGPHVLDVLIPKGYRINTQGVNPILTFNTISDVLIPAGNTTATVGVREGVLKTYTIVGDGTPSQRVTLFDTDIGDNTIEVSIDNYQWTKVDDFSSSQFDSYHYVVETNWKDETTVYFGDGSFGRIPPANRNIVIKYLSSSGSFGNEVGANTINVPVDVVVDVNGSPVQVIIDNANGTQGGSDRETIEHAKAQAPAEFKTRDADVLVSDYITTALSVPGIVKANAWGEDQENPPNLEMRNTVKVVAMPEGGGPLSGVLLDELNDIFYGNVSKNLPRRVPATVRVLFVQPQYISTTVDVSIYIKPTAIAADVKSAVESDLIDLMSTLNQDFKKPLRVGNILSIATNAHPGIAYAEINLPTSDISPGLDEIIILGSLGVTIAGITNF